MRDLPQLVADSGATGFDEKATGWRLDSYSEIGIGWVGIVLSILAWRRRTHPGLLPAPAAIPAAG